MKNILILNLTNFDEQRKIFIKLLDTVKKENISLIVVDGMAMLYRLEFGDARKEGDEEIKEVVSLSEAI